MLPSACSPIEKKKIGKDHHNQNHRSALSDYINEAGVDVVGTLCCRWPQANTAVVICEQNNPEGYNNSWKMQNYVVVNNDNNR